MPTARHRAGFFCTNPMTIKSIARVFPPRFTSRLLSLSIKAELAAQESRRGRDNPSYLAVIREIDAAREEARSRCPHLFRYAPTDSLDLAPVSMQAGNPRGSAYHIVPAEGETKC